MIALFLVTLVIPTKVYPRWAPVGDATLLGVVMGGALSYGTEMLRRRWQRADEIRKLTISRGEELLEQCHKLYEWYENARRLAFSADFFLPAQVPMFRIAALVELYFTELSSQSHTLDTAVQQCRELYVGVAS